MPRRGTIEISPAFTQTHVVVRAAALVPAALVLLVPLVFVVAAATTAATTAVAVEDLQGVALGMGGGVRVWDETVRHYCPAARHQTHTHLNIGFGEEPGLAVNLAFPPALANVLVKVEQEQQGVRLWMLPFFLFSFSFHRQQRGTHAASRPPGG